MIALQRCVHFFCSHNNLLLGSFFLAKISTRLLPEKITLEEVDLGTLTLTSVRGGWAEDTGEETRWCLSGLEEILEGPLLYEDLCMANAWLGLRLRTIVSGQRKALGVWIG